MAHGTPHQPHSTICETKKELDYKMKGLFFNNI